MLDTVFGQAVGQGGPVDRIKTIRGRRPLRLQVEDHIVLVGKSPHQRLIGRTQGFKDAQHQHGHALADRHLDLRQTAPDRQRRYQLTQGHDQCRDVRLQVRALGDLGHIRTFALVKADQRGAGLVEHEHRKTRPRTVSPRRAVNRRIKLLGLDLRQMPEIGFKQTLLGSHLRRAFQMLHAASTTNAIMRAPWRYPARRLLEHPLSARNLVGRLAANADEFHRLTRQCALDKDRLALKPRNPACFVIQRFNDSAWHTKS